MRQRIRIRAFEHGDLPAVASLYERVMRSGSRAASPALAAALRNLFLDTPTYAPDIPSLVIETETGIEGFHGVQVKEFDFKSTRRRLASLGPLLVSPDLRSGATAVLMMKRVMNGPQDLSMSDGAIDEVRQMWEKLGGTMAVPQSLEWTIALEPAKALIEFGTLRYSDSAFRSATVTALRPVAAAVDRFIARRWRAQFLAPIGERPETRPLSAELMCSLSGELKMKYRLRMVYTPEIADWVFSQLTTCSWRGELIARSVELRGNPVGWYIAYASRGILNVMQIHADIAHVPRVLSALIHEALQRRLVAVKGRLDGALASALPPFRPQFLYGMRVLAHARDREILDAVLSLDAALSRIDGESLMGIRHEDYDTV